MSPKVSQILSSSVGTKLVIGLTGLALFLYMVLHLAGNVIVFFGPEMFNAYSHQLISNPLIIPAEIGLLLVFLVHIYKTIVMWRRNKAARPVPYQKKELAGHTSRKSVASSTMVASGLLILIFVVIHVKQFKFGSFYLAAGSESIRDLYRTEVEVFRQPLWVVLYVIAPLLVGLHLRHGISSAFQSIGAEHPRYTRHLVTTGIVLAIVIGAGLAVIPLWVYLTH
jgi:succinate dehydrogenase / fumarate reductase cytochrome b subunit